MKKIAIYGDSYGASFQGWPRYLEKFYNDCRVTTFALGGSSPNYSYLKFLETHEKYDIVIFLWTCFTRNGLITKIPEKDKYTVHGFTNNVHSRTEEFKEEVLINTKRSITNYQITKKYHGDVISDIDTSWVMHESLYSAKYPTKNYLENLALRDSVKFKRPDSINIECFGLDNCDICLWNVTFNDWIQFIPKDVDFNSIEYSDEIKKRPNHLSLKQNEELASYIYKQIEDKSFDIHSTFKNAKKYYTMSKTLEEAGFVL